MEIINQRNIPMKLKLIPGVIIIFLFILGSCISQKDKSQATDDYTVAVYYFPNYHVDKRNEKYFGEGWTEWKLVKEATPRYEGHQQPKVPLWGYTDEADPLQMDQKIEAASSNGIDVFIFDWYYYDDGLFLERALEEGFMKADNNSLMEFSLMWANHDYIQIFPYTAGEERTLMYPGVIKPETWDTMTSYIIEKYFRHPSYWCIDGAPYFSIYDLSKFLAIFGSVEGTVKGMNEFREKTKAAGFRDLHLNAVVWGNINLITGEVVENAARFVEELGFSSVTSYVWFHHTHEAMSFQTDSYDNFMDEYFKYADEAVKSNNLPYFPNVTMGWDSSPRTNQDLPHTNAGYPYTQIIVGNTPEKFRDALLHSREFMDTNLGENKVLTINSWNEWTEGSYLEPDTVDGMAYLHAIKEVFK